MPSRFIFHPILENEKSRKIFFIFLVIAFGVGLGVNIYIYRTLKLIGLDAQSPLIIESHFKFLLSNYFRAALIFGSAIIGSVLTAGYAVGPVKRIEQWLQDWNDGLNPFPLLTRKNEKFSNLARLLNALYQKSTRPNPPE